MFVKVVNSENFSLKEREGTKYRIHVGHVLTCPSVGALVVRLVGNKQHMKVQIVCLSLLVLLVLVVESCGLAEGVNLGDSDKVVPQLTAIADVFVLLPVVLQDCHTQVVHEVLSKFLPNVHAAHVLKPIVVLAQKLLRTCNAVGHKSFNFCSYILRMATMSVRLNLLICWLAWCTFSAVPSP